MGSHRNKLQFCVIFLEHLKRQLKDTMDKFLTNFAKSVALTPPQQQRRRSSVYATVKVDLPEARQDAEFSEIRGHLKGKDPKEKVRREL